MAYRLMKDDRTIADDWSLLTGALGCHDTLGDPEMTHGRDFILHERSVYELVRDQLSVAQRAELDRVDAHWRANADAFNADFAAFHARENRATALEGMVEDEAGNTPRIPRDHWWWRPIEEA